MPSKASNNLVTQYLWWPSLLPSPSPYCSSYLSLLAAAHECQLHPLHILPERLPSQTRTVLIPSLLSNLRSGSAQVLPSSPYLKMQASSIWHFWNSLPCFSVSFSRSSPLYRTTQFTYFAHYHPPLSFPSSLPHPQRQGSFLFHEEPKL